MTTPDESSEGACSVVARLQQLLDIATRLEKAGWRMWFTLTGLAFEPPDEELGDTCEELDDTWVAERLKGLGIDEEFSPFLGRTLDEVAEAEGELCERVWYERKLVLVNEPGYDPAAEFKKSPDIIRGMLRGMQRVEQKYGKEDPAAEGPFDWGMTNGKLSALRWVLGDEWDMLDT
jgi:hypothetical protein